jgi:hypothetical protein
LDYTQGTTSPENTDNLGGDLLVFDEAHSDRELIRTHTATAKLSWAERIKWVTKNAERVFKWTPAQINSYCQYAQAHSPYKDDEGLVMTLRGNIPEDSHTTTSIYDCNHIAGSMITTFRSEVDNPPPSIVRDVASNRFPLGNGHTSALAAKGSFVDSGEEVEREERMEEEEEEEQEEIEEEKGWWRTGNRDEYDGDKSRDKSEGELRRLRAVEDEWDRRRTGRVLHHSTEVDRCYPKVSASWEAKSRSINGGVCLSPRTTEANRDNRTDDMQWKYEEDKRARKEARMRKRQNMYLTRRETDLVNMTDAHSATRYSAHRRMEEARRKSAKDTYLLRSGREMVRTGMWKAKDPEVEGI